MSLMDIDFNQVRLGYLTFDMNRSAGFTFGLKVLHGGTKMIYHSKVVVFFICREASE